MFFDYNQAACWIFPWNSLVSTYSPPSVLSWAHNEISASPPFCTYRMEPERVFWGKAYSCSENRSPINGTNLCFLNFILNQVWLLLLQCDFTCGIPKVVRMGIPQIGAFTYEKSLRSTKIKHGIFNEFLPGKTSLWKTTRLETSIGITPLHCAWDLRFRKRLKWGTGWSLSPTWVCSQFHDKDHVPRQSCGFSLFPSCCNQPGPLKGLSAAWGLCQVWSVSCWEVRLHCVLFALVSARNVK